VQSLCFSANSHLTLWKSLFLDHLVRMSHWRVAYFIFDSLCFPSSYQIQYSNFYKIMGFLFSVGKNYQSQCVLIRTSISYTPFKTVCPGWCTLLFLVCWKRVSQSLAKAFYLYLNNSVGVFLDYKSTRYLGWSYFYFDFAIVFYVCKILDPKTSVLAKVHCFDLSLWLSESVVFEN